MGAIQRLSGSDPSGVVQDDVISLTGSWRPGDKGRSWCRESSRIRLSGFAGTSHYERGSVMDSDFWASRILVAWDLPRVPVS